MSSHKKVKPVKNKDLNKVSGGLTISSITPVSAPTNTGSSSTLTEGTAVTQPTLTEGVAKPTSGSVLTSGTVKRK